MLLRGLFAAALFLPALAFADPVADLTKAMQAFEQAKSFHADEHFSNGHTVAVDFSAPDRWCIHPTRSVTKLVIGNDVYMVSKGRPSKLPFGGMMVSKLIGASKAEPMNDQIEQTARDLGMQTVSGQSVRASSFTSRNVPETLYVGSNGLPARAVTQDKKVTTTIGYSKWNEPILVASAAHLRQNECSPANASAEALECSPLPRRCGKIAAPPCLHGARRGDGYRRRLLSPACLAQSPRRRKRRSR